MGGFEVDGAEVVEGRVTTERVVERLDVVEHRSGEFGAGVPVVAVEKLAPFNPNAG